MSQEKISQRIEISSERETRLFAQDLAVILQSGDCVCLIGALGTGKTVLVREIIRCIAGDDDLEVPSPTYTLQQYYPTSPAVYHYDFYRLNDPAEVAELGLEEASEDGISFIEWPQIYNSHLPPESIHIEFSASEEEARSLSLRCTPAFMERFLRTRNIRKFLDDGWAPGISRKPLMGDASTRAYELVSNDNETRILMNSPKMPDGPVIPEYGRPYSQIAHLAEDVSAFVAIDELLRMHGFNAPEIFAQDLDRGFLLTEYLGDEPVITQNREPIMERYLVATELLARLHQVSWPKKVIIENHLAHHFAQYDENAILIEVGLLTEWYIPHMLSRKCTPGELDEFREIWRGLHSISAASPQTLVLRDFHSPNLIWQNHGAGTDRISIIDFQDALLGPESYDVASLAQDARVRVDETLEQQLVDHYVGCRRKLNPGFSESEFVQNYAIMAAQRATKVLGIFVRLHKRDKKPAYLQHIPTIRSYLDRSFAHPVLSDYKNWFERMTDGSNR